ncbi:hypothetical protein CBR_g54164 [Chara braunii]|uniref:Uncharacterized protein n=1 Tax=Chara braunii TaxID=69332 RepID=A0A388K745_CHABU|nr:hypothetical protein CBR_g54164 [Chara braunii]|eukprot:GBG65872.1 hypothetical protein CBR_g54164 [Chara braunii]
MSDEEDAREDDRILRSARRPVAHLALRPKGDRYLFRQRRERLQQRRRARAAEASRALVSEAAALEAMATSTQQSTQAGSSGSVGSTVAQTQSQSAGVMASQPIVLTSDEIAIQQAALQEAQLQKALGDIKAEKERMIRRRVRMQRRQADISELEEMDLTQVTDDVRLIRSVLLNVVEMQDHQTTILQDIQQSLALLVGRAQTTSPMSGPGAWPVVQPPPFVPPVTGVSPYVAPSSVAIVSLGMPLSGGVSAGTSLQVPVQTVFTQSPLQVVVTTQPAVLQTVQPQGTQPQQLVQQPVSQGPQPGVMQGPGQTQWVPKTTIAAPKPFTRDKRGEDLDTWLRAVPVYVRCKLTLPHEEVLVAASYLEDSAARWLSGLVQLQGYGHDFRAWALTQKLDDFLKLVEERWHDPQETQRAIDAILALHTRQFKSVREATDDVERLICVPGVRYDPQVLLTSYLRCFSLPLRNQLAGQANINMHNFPSFSKKALDLEAKIGHGQAPTTDGRKKTLPPNWKAKGRIMFVDNDGSTIELNDNFQEAVGAEAGSVEASGGGVVATVAQKGEPVKIPSEIEGVVAKYPDLFEEPTGVVEREVVHAIEIIPGSSILKGRIYRMSPGELDELRRQLKELVEKGWIRPSVSPYGSPVLFHVAHLDKVLSLLRQHKFKINGEKCEFGRTRVLYLGNEIFAEGLKPDDAKVASIRDWPRPQSVTEMRSFLGMTGYYRPFVKNYSIVATPLTDLTHLDTPWEWTDECEAAFRHLKHALTHYEVLKLPDPDKPFIVTTDASQYGIGAVLAQQEGLKLRPVEYMSKKMPSQKLAKSTYEKELYAVYKALTHWRHYLVGRFFILRTDHQTLRWMRTQPELSDALKRWIEVIEQYDFDPQYLKGEYNKVVDALSRRPDFSGALITEFDLTDSVTQSLVEAYREDQFMSEIIRRLEAKDKKTSAEFVLVNGLLFLEKEGNKRLCVPNSESLRSLFLEANGQAEQMNRAVQHLLRHYIKPNQVDWDEKLALIASLYNNAIHSATGVSPNSLLLTFKPRPPLDFLLPENQSTAAPGTLEFAYRYEQKMQQAVKQMQKAQAAMIESENRHCRPSTFQVGDRVWVKSSQLRQEYGISRKLMPQYFGPWEVLDIVGTDPDGPSYVVRIPGHLRTYPVFHASKLAPFKETDQFPSRRSMLPQTMDGEVNIDDIVDHRELPVPRTTGRGRPPKPKLQYRVRFRHHTDPKEDRWFTRDELMQTAPQVVAHCEKSLQKGKRPMVED